MATKHCQALSDTSLMRRQIEPIHSGLEELILPLPTEIFLKIADLLINDNTSTDGKTKWKDVQGFAMASKALLQVFRPVWFHTLTIDSFARWEQIIDSPSVFLFVRHIQVRHPSRFWKERWYPIFLRFFKNLSRITVRGDTPHILYSLLRAVPSTIHELHVTLESSEAAPKDFYSFIPRKLPELRSLSLKVDGMISLPIGTIQDAGAKDLVDLIIPSDGSFKNLRHLDLGFGLSECSVFENQCPESCGELGCCVKCRPWRSETEAAELAFAKRAAQVAPQLETVRVRSWFSHHGKGTATYAIDRKWIGCDDFKVVRTTA